MKRSLQDQESWSAPTGKQSAKRRIVKESSRSEVPGAKRPGDRGEMPVEAEDCARCMPSSEGVHPSRRVGTGAVC